MVNNKKTLGIIAVIVIVVIFGVWTWSPAESQEENVVSPAPEEADENSLDQDQVLPKEHERLIFFIENPKYEKVNEQLLMLFERDFPDEREQWEDYSYIVIKYLYGMMTGDIEHVKSVFKTQDPDQIEQHLQKRVGYYNDIQIDEFTFYSDSRNEIMLLYMLNEEEEDRGRVLLFETKSSMITLDNMFVFGEVEEFLNFYFDLPPIEDILQQGKYEHLHEAIIHQVEMISPDFKLAGRLADGVIYYLHGMLTGNTELVSNFFPGNDEGFLNIIETDMLFYESLKSYTIELVNIEKHEEFPEMLFLDLRFHMDDDIQTISISVQLIHFLTFFSYYDDKLEYIPDRRQDG